MFFHSFTGRVLGLLICGTLLVAAEVSAAPKSGEVSIENKAKGVAEFRLADYQDELLECSALAAVHTLIGDSIGDDEGSQVRSAISNDYWIEVSHGYMSLAQEARGEEDLVQEVGIQIRGLIAEWRRLTETDVSAADWSGWFELTDLCDTWRPAKPAHSYYSRGREPTADQNHAGKVAMRSE